MDTYLFKSQYSWKEFFMTLTLLAVIYVILYLFQAGSKRLSLAGYFQTKIRQISRKLFLLYEIVALIILVGIFILINPIFHGILTFLLAWTSFDYIKSYVSGRWIALDNIIIEGTELKTKELQGVVSKMGRLKMDFQTNEGLCHIHYDRLLADGYTLVSGDEIGGFYYLEFSPKNTLKDIKNHRIYLMDLLATAPYIDWNQKPEIFRDDNKSNSIDVRILIKEEDHLHDLMLMVKEWGYDCKLVSS